MATMLQVRISNLTYSDDPARRKALKLRNNYGLRKIYGQHIVQNLIFNLPHLGVVIILFNHWSGDLWQLIRDRKSDKRHLDEGWKDHIPIRILLRWPRHQWECESVPCWVFTRAIFTHVWSRKIATYTHLRDPNQILKSLTRAVNDLCS